MNTIPVASAGACLPVIGQGNGFYTLNSLGKRTGLSARKMAGFVFGRYWRRILHSAKNPPSGKIASSELQHETKNLPMGSKIACSIGVGQIKFMGAHQQSLALMIVSQ